jgi:hypothetical protein
MPEPQSCRGSFTLCLECSLGPLAYVRKTRAEERNLVNAFGEKYS